MTRNLPGLALALFLLTLPATAQLIPPNTPLPKRPNPPVIFINGYQADCTGSSFSSTFGTADQILAASNLTSVFFDNCTLPNHPSIEALGQELGKFLNALKYEDNTPVTTVDVVVHSMGGLILRSYLSGKDPAGTGFNPPPTIPIRRAVFLATPQFGTSIATLLGAGSDKQLVELTSGSRFLFDLGTWNQGTDDLRGINAIAILGNAGNGNVILGVGSGNPAFDDGVVTITSGSLRFYQPNRTRLISACHVGPGIISVLCPNAPGIADFGSSPLTAVAVVAFLTGNDAWQSIGAPAEQNTYLSAQSGLEVQVRTADDQVASITTVTATSKGTSKKLNLGAAKDTAYTDLLPAGAVNFDAAATGATVQKSVGVDNGTYAAITLKPGPFVSRVLPAASNVFPLNIAPGEIIAIYGDNLANSQITVNGTALKLIASSPSQVNAFFPTGLSGLVQLTAKDTTGSHTINVLVAPTVPAIFTQNQSGAGPASALNAITNQLVTSTNPLRAGDYVAIYLTGLGATTTQGSLEIATIQPTVTIGGKPCIVTFAGRAPGYPGLDQINCQIPTGLTAGDADVVVISGTRRSNTAILPVR